MKAKLIVVGLLGLALGLVLGLVRTSDEALASSRFSLECDSYNKAEEYLQCEGARAARDLADTVMRIEKKLPDFNKM